MWKSSVNTLNIVPSVRHVDFDARMFVCVLRTLAMASQHLHERSSLSGELENQGGDFLPSGDGSSLTVTASNFMIQLSHLYMTTGKIIALTIWDFCQKSDVSAFNNMLSRFVIAYL